MPLLAAEIPAKCICGTGGNRRTNVHILKLPPPPAYVNQALDCSIYFLSKTKVMFVTNDGNVCDQ